MAIKKSGSFTARLSKWRAWIQAAFLLLWLDPMMLRMHGVCSPVFHCYSCPWALFACPIGVLANFSAIHVFPFVAVGTLVAVAVTFGTLVCGWACPFGFLQDLIGRIPTPKFELPAWMGYTRYVVLVSMVLAIPFFFGESHPLFFCRLCPAGALEAALPNTISTALSGPETVWPTAGKIAVFVLVVIAMFLVRRPWCALFCPLGAIFSLGNHVSLFYLQFRKDTCNDCNLCNSLCSYGGPAPSRTGDQRCIRCLDCTRCDTITLGSVFSDSGKSQDTEQP